MEIKKNLSFILSTGRTGTMFFQDYINDTSESAICIHEPKPSRHFIPLSNMVYQNVISEKRFNQIYYHSRRNLFKKIKNKNYIESSNFMWAGVKALNKFDSNIKILHLIRHPQDYISSHMDYGFWKGYKKLIRSNIPYFVADFDIKTNDPIEILGKRWSLINETISTYQNTNPYLQIRFEDLFKSPPNTAVVNLNKIRSFFDLNEYPISKSIEILTKPKNSSIKLIDTNKDVMIREYCERNLINLMKDLNYKIK